MIGYYPNGIPARTRMQKFIKWMFGVSPKNPPVWHVAQEKRGIIIGRRY